MSGEILFSTTRSRSARKPAWANSHTLFAVLMMFVLGLWQILGGIAAVVRDGSYVPAPVYVYSFYVAWWGWLHLLLGVFTVGAAVAVLQGRRWAAQTAIVLTSLSLIANFVLVPENPIWSMLIIGLNVAVIGLLTTRERDTT